MIWYFSPSVLLLASEHASSFFIFVLLWRYYSYSTYSSLFVIYPSAVQTKLTRILTKTNSNGEQINATVGRPTTWLVSAKDNPHDPVAHSRKHTLTHIRMTHMHLHINTWTQINTLKHAHNHLNQRNQKWSFDISAAAFPLRSPILVPAQRSTPINVNARRTSTLTGQHRIETSVNNQRTARNWCYKYLSWRVWTYDACAWHCVNGTQWTSRRNGFSKIRHFDVRMEEHCVAGSVSKTSLATHSHHKSHSWLLDRASFTSIKSPLRTIRRSLKRTHESDLYSLKSQTTIAVTLMACTPHAVSA